MLYTKEDFTKIKRRGKRMRVLLALMILGALAAGLIPMLVARSMAVSVILSSVCALVTIFLYGTLFGRTFAYQRFMLQAEEGISHRFEGAFLGAGEESVRDNVRFIAVHFDVGEDTEPRRCYVDSSLFPVALQEGKRYTLTHTGNSLIAINPL